MKILFVTYPWAGLNKGGLQIQIDETRNALVELGFEVDLYDPWQCNVKEYDVIHLFSINPSIKPFADAASESTIPLVVSPIFSAYHSNNFLLQLKIAVSRRINGLFSYQRMSGIILDKASRVVALSGEEKTKLVDVFSLRADDVDVVPNGISESFVGASSKLFIDKYGLENFVLSVGRIEEWKNQLELIRACKELQKNLVIIGPANEKSKDYYIKCKEEADGSVLFLGEVNNSDPILASAYQAASIFALVSRSEVFPISALEAAASNCKLLITNRNAIGSVFEKVQGVEFVEPEKDEIVKSIKRLDQAQSPNIVKSIQENYTWSSVASQLSDVYKKAIVK